MTIFGLLVGGFGGFARFYFQFQDRDMVNRLKNENASLRSELGKTQMELKEYYQQNLILKDKTTNLLTQNDDYNKIVWELNRYYFHLKTWYDKAKELTDALNVFDKDFEWKMGRIWQYIPTISVDTSKLNPEKINIPQSQSFSSAPVAQAPVNNQIPATELKVETTKTKQESLSDYENPRQTFKSENISDFETKKIANSPKGRVYVSIDEDETEQEKAEQDLVDEEITISEDAPKVDKKFF